MMMVKQNIINKTWINIDHITCNDCGEKCHYAWNSELSKQKKTKEDAEAFRIMKQVKYGNKPPYVGGEQ